MPLGVNICLLEDRCDGELQTLVDKDDEWLRQWFKEVLPWRQSDVDDAIVVWI